MSKARQCITKAATLRAQADKLEKVAALVGRDADEIAAENARIEALILDDSDELVSSPLGIGAGALGLLGGGVYGIDKFMKRRANEAVIAAQKSRLLKGALGGALGLGGIGALGVLGALGVGTYDLHRIAKKLG